MKTIRRFALLTAAVLAGVGTAALLAFHHDIAAQWVASLYALASAAHRSVGMAKQILRGHWGIDLLAVTAIGSTVAVGEYIASLIIVLVLAGGNALEDYAEGKAVRELRSLLERAPRSAHRELSNAALEDIPVGQVQVGDVLVVRPSEVVPVDGLLLSTDGVFDGSALTGESLPVEHGAGAALLSGSVNGDAAVRIRPTATAEDSQYSRIVMMVEEASSSRAPLVRLADRYAVPFTALAFLLAGTA